MSNVIRLVPTPALSVSREDMADYVQAIADSIRSGDLKIDRAILVMAMSEGGVATDVFGGPTNVMEAVGLLSIGQFELTRNPAGEQP